MSKYQIVTMGGGTGFIRRKTTTNPYSNYEYFSGYDFMGSVNWAEESEASEMSLGEAQQIVSDLESSIEDCGVVECINYAYGKRVIVKKESCGFRVYVQEHRSIIGQYTKTDDGSWRNCVIWFENDIESAKAAASKYAHRDA